MGVAHPMQFPLLDEVEESQELLAECGIVLIQAQEAGPALGDGGRVVDWEAVAVKLDGERHSFGVWVIVGRGTRTGAEELLSLLAGASPEGHLHLPHTQHVPAVM